MKMNEKVAHVGLDHHKNFGRATARDAQGRIVGRQRLEYRDRAGLRAQMKGWPPGTPVVLEGSFGWSWICDELESAGHDPHLSSTRKTAKWREARGVAKSNRVDADLISELWPQPNVNGERWWEVWLPPRPVRDRRELMRYRMGLVQMQTTVKNRIHALLHRHGILHGLSDVFGKKGMIFLRQLCDKEDATLREAGQRTLKGMLNLLLFLRKDIAAMTWEFRRQLRKDASADLWRSVPGIGWVLGYTIAAETGDIGRFKSSRQLKAYSLLAPLADDSGEESEQGNKSPRGRHVGWVGRTTLKWAFIEAAHGAIRKSVRFRATFDRHTNGGARDRNRGYIAVAAELCHIGMACVKNGRSYSEERPVRPGAQKATQKKSVLEQIKEQMIADPESGQPGHPMAEIDGKQR